MEILNPQQRETLQKALNGFKIPANDADRDIEKVKTILNHLHNASGPKFRTSLNNLAEAIERLMGHAHRNGYTEGYNKAKKEQP